MSGQPNRYANSAEKFRNEYMDALNSRANVDEFNLQANKNYKATGTLPPNVKAMVDNRTTTEILADSEKLKLNIISELKPVMNSGTASVVVQKIQTAPSNADGSFLIWVAQNIPEIVKTLKKKYALGIKGDTQDATNIVIFLSDMYNKIKEYSGTVKSYFDTVGESKSGLKEGDLDALWNEYEVIIARLKSKYPNYRQPSEFKINDLINKTTRKIEDLYGLLTSENYRNTIRSLLSITGDIELSQVNGINDVGKAMFKLMDNLPSVSLIRTLYSQLDKSISNKNLDLSTKILTEIYDQFPTREEIDQVNNAIIAGNQPTKPPTTESFKGPKPPEGKNKITPKSLIQYIVSFRNECHFHEEICEAIYKRIDLCEPEELRVSCYYVRRGSLDINPVRATHEHLLEDYLLDTNIRFCKTPRQ